MITKVAPFTGYQRILFFFWFPLDVAGKNNMICQPFNGFGWDILASCGGRDMGIWTWGKGRWALKLIKL